MSWGVLLVPGRSLPGRRTPQTPRSALRSEFVALRCCSTRDNSETRSAQNLDELSFTSARLQALSKRA